MCFLFKILACRGFNFTTTHTSDLVFDEESAPQDCAFMPWYWSINSSCFPVWLRQGHIPCVQSSPWLPYILNIPFKQILPMCILQCVGLFGIPNWRCWCLMLLVAINCKPQSSCFRTPHLPTNVLPPHSKVLHEFVSYDPPLPTHCHFLWVGLHLWCCLFAWHQCPNCGKYVQRFMHAWTIVHSVRSAMVSIWPFIYSIGNMWSQTPMWMQSRDILEVVEWTKKIWA